MIPFPARFAARAAIAVIVAILLARGVGGAAAAEDPPPLPAPPTPPAVRREFRGVWVASVANIDWPSRPGLPADAQKAELIVLLDRAKQLHLNAVVLQVRPAADALYASALEPWSEYLSGTAGKAPEPAYDPLAFVVAEAHRRGLELHAWFNPFRARHASAKSEPSPGHVSRTHPDWVRAYGKQSWLDPGEPAVQEYNLGVLLDVVRRYDVDGVHLDDYFYPYPENDPATGAPIPFPDDATYARYQAGSGGTLGRADWRRDNVNTFVRRLYEAVKKEKPWVKMGVSPFGIWRPGSPAQIAGLDAYDSLSADSRRWLREGWVDYLSPQLYWKIEQTAQGFAPLLGWWAGENTLGRHLWPGLFASRASGPTPAWPADEIAYQIRTTRGQAGATGNLLFSARALAPETAPAGSAAIGSAAGLGALLANGVYAAPALVPASPWLSNDVPPPARPVLAVADTQQGNGGGVSVSWRPGDETNAGVPWLWVVQARFGASAWTTRIVPAEQSAQLFAAGARRPDTVCVFGVDRFGSAGPMAVTAVPGVPAPPPELPFLPFFSGLPLTELP